MSSVDSSGGTGGGGAPGPGGSSVGGGGGVGSGGGPGSVGGGTSSNNGALNSNLAGMGSTQTPTGVAAKISHVKATIDGTLVNTSTSGGSNLQLGSGIASGVSTIMTSSVSTTGPIKMTTAGGAIATSIGGTPIALNVAQSPTAIRTIGAGGQSTQVRVVMPTNIIPIKQFDHSGVGRTQITAISAGVAGVNSRTVSNTSITVTRPVTQTTYLPRAGVTATQMTAVCSGQRLVTPIRTGPGSGNMNTSATVTGLATAGGFVRGATATVNRNTSSPATSVISSGTSTAWMQTNTGQVQLIRAIPQQTQKRIITAQGMTTTTGSYSNTGLGGGLGTSVSGTVLATTPPTVVQTGGGGQNQNQQSGQGGQSTIQAVPSSGVSHGSQPQSQQQQTYVATLATVLPPRQHQATLVYSSNVAPTSQPLTQQPQQFNPTLAAGQRLAVATQLSAAATSVTGTTSRQIRPIALPKSFSAAKLNTTSISIRAPNITSTLQPVAGGVIGGSVGSVVASANAASNNSSRNTTMGGVTTGVGGNVIPTANLPTTRIIQLQQQPGTAQPIIGSTGRLSGNVMFQPLIVNASGTGKLVSSLRQPVSMTAKPSLTITPFGLPKMTATGSGNATQIGVNLQQQQQQIATSMQSSIGSNNNMGSSSSGAGGSGSPALSINTPTSSGGSGANLSTAQLVNVSQATGQLLATQNIVSSGAGGGATVLPLAITSRGNNILTGTITPLKNAGAITVGKVMTAANVGNLDSSNSGPGGASIITSSAGPPTSVYIHQAPPTQRTHGPSVSISNASLHAPSSASSSNTTVLTTTGSGIPTSGSAFLPPGGTIYYESIPASSMQVSTGVLSLTTTTATNSTLQPTQNQLANAVSASNLAISSLPFAASAASHAGNSTATFTVVPSAGGRSIGQLQIPVSAAPAGTQIQVPLRFSTQGAASASSSNTISADTISVSQATQQLLQQGGIAGGQQLLIPASAAAAAAVHQAGSGSATATLAAAQGQHVVIPLQTSIKVSGGNAGSTVVSNFLRKRDADGSPVRAAKNLAPTLLSMSGTCGGASMSNVTASPAASSVGSVFSITSVASSMAPSQVQPSSSSSSSAALTTEALAKKDRAQASTSGGGVITQRVVRGESPASSDGSTTVSANSSPGVEQQMQDGNMMMINHMPHGTNESTHFNPINEMYANHHGNVNMQHNALLSAGGATPRGSRNSSLDHHQQLHAPQATASSARLNGGPIECSSRKKSRRSTNDSQLSSHSQGSLSLPPPTATGVAISHMNAMNSNSGNNSSNYDLSAAATGNGGMLLAPAQGSMAPGPSSSSISSHQYDGNNTSANAAHTNNSNHKNNNLPPAAGNKENAKPTEFTLRRPRNFSLLNTYKQNWKTANNHFQRYSDVKPREERRPTVIDLANQANVMGKINGWKLYHLSSQMEDLCENESTGLEQLNNMLKQMETHEKNPEIERINELLKGNIQRSKIVADGIHEAQSQMMKIFEHKSHISDILQRCASKRNFKKREKF